MSTPPIRLLHISARVRGGGGIESLLARHARMDGAGGFDAAQLALFDRTPGLPGEAYATQNFSWRDTPRGMRRAMARTLAARAGGVVVWHNAWGLPWFGDVDGAARRIIYLHSSEAYFGAWLPGLRGWADGVVCCSPAAARAAARLLPELPAGRVVHFHQPISPPAWLTAERPAQAAGAEWVLGCAGRLVREHKRWERFVPFVAELRRLGVPFRLEVVGDGPLRPWLERKLGGEGTRFFGWLDGEDFWRRLQGWDAALFFSDLEGMPLVLLETLAAGVVPIYPAMGGSLGDDYAPRVDARCLYPAGDPVAAARALRAMLAEPPEFLAGIRRRARALAEPHGGGAYDAEFAEFVRRVAEEPRVSRVPGGGRRARLADWLPLGFLTRAWPAALWR